jgi:hypothetical protein
MKPQFQQAYNALRTLGVPLFERDDQPGRFFISAEHPESGEWVSYYSGDRDWIFGVHPAIDSTLRQFDLFAEWENPGCLVVCEA